MEEEIDEGEKGDVREQGREEQRPYEVAARLAASSLGELARRDRG